MPKPTRPESDALEVTELGWGLEFMRWLKGQVEQREPRITDAGRAALKPAADRTEARDA